MDNYIARSITPKIIYAAEYFPVILITGARQVGKSTLCRHIFHDFQYVNMEDADNLFAAKQDIKGFFESLGERVIIDEAQNCTELFPQILVRVDENPSLRYVLTGSNQFNLMKNACQSLAGRVAIFELPPLTFEELIDEQKCIPTEDLFYRGFYPSVITGKRPADLFYDNYYTTYIERDIRSQLKVENLSKFDKFVRLIAARVGSESNMSSLALEVGVSAKTISEWVSILEASYIIFPLRPYHANISKRLTKSPKWYFHDVGLVAYLLGVEKSDQLIHHPLRGSLFENMAVAELQNRILNKGRKNGLYFYREQSGREVDVLQIKGDGVDAYEIKSAKTYNSQFIRNLNYLKEIIPENVLSSTVVYDGRTMAPIAINVRDL